ncbi:MAG: 4'-phosphopantetheinyl transferase, partial [Verrucomicrobia bacterium]|nr:4'-phosphopantetheinyl transferase [Verrucomicrobiota bacterium]
GLGGGLANVTIASDGAAAWLHGSRYGLSLWTQEGYSVAVAEGNRG